MIPLSSVGRANQKSLQRSKIGSQKCSNFNRYSCLAQSVERLTVNQDVTGSSPVAGAKKIPQPSGLRDFCFRKTNDNSKDQNSRYQQKAKTKFVKSQ